MFRKKIYRWLYRWKFTYGFPKGLSGGGGSGLVFRFRDPRWRNNNYNEKRLISAIRFWLTGTGLQAKTAVIDVSIWIISSGNFGHLLITVVIPDFLLSASGKFKGEKEAGWLSIAKKKKVTLNVFDSNYLFKYGKFFVRKRAIDFNHTVHYKRTLANRYLQKNVNAKER